MDTTTPVAVPPDEDTRIKLEFGFGEDYCSYDPDQMLEGASERVVALAAEHASPKATDDLDSYGWDTFADRLDRLATEADDDTEADALTDAADVVRDGLHRCCDCTEFEFEYFTEYANGVLTELTDGSCVVAVYAGAYDDESPSITGEELTFEQLSEKFGGRGYDGVRIVFDRATGEGDVWFSDRGWGRGHHIYVVTDPDRVSLIGAFLETGTGYDHDYLVRELADVHATPELVAAVTVLASSSLAADNEDNPYGYTLADYQPSDLLDKLTAAGVMSMSREDLVALARLANRFDGSLPDLVAVLFAAAA